MKKYLFIALTLLMAVGMQVLGTSAQAQVNNGPNGESVITVSEARDILDNDRYGAGQYVVKGIITRFLTEDVGYGNEAVVIENGKMTFLIGDINDNYATVTACQMNNVNNQPFTSSEQLALGDTVYAYGTLANLAYETLLGDQYQIIDGYVLYRGCVNCSNQAVAVEYPRAEVMYDLNGDGTKQIIDKAYLGENNMPAISYIEDLNGDGIPDVSSFSYGEEYVSLWGATWLSGASGYTRNYGKFAVTNMDINRDGRKDYLVLDQYRTQSNRSSAYFGKVGYQLADGSFNEETMQVYTWDEFVAQMTDEESDQYQNPQNYSLGDVSRYTYTASLGAVYLARAPQRNAPQAKKAPGVGSVTAAPTKAIDMNGDGLIDLIDEKDGIIYTNMGNGKWVWTATNGAVVPADLNNDGVLDFIFPGAKLYVSIYNKTTNQFVTKTLYQNATVDNAIYCYDFDKDGDVDILATFTAENNSSGYAYTCFFTNDGNGNFTKQREQNYGSNKLAFMAMQDLDGDGYYDLLAYKEAGNNKYDLVWIKNQSGLQFNTTPQTLATELITRQVYWDSSKQPFTDFPVNAEDLDNDGKMDIWVSGTYYDSGTAFFHVANAVANVRPSAPAQPTLSYSNGLLTITWGNGADDKTAVNDLTYALRIGTTPGGNDILAAHANADGTRRNFLDGNMGKEHTYTIDLRTYNPSTIYVAVQTIDAQHAGSVWSQEASVTHDYVPVEFVLNKTTIAFNGSITLTYTELPAGYSHQWTIEDGTYQAIDNTKLRISFTQPGTKTITHIVTTPSGNTLSSVATVTILPAGLGQAKEISNDAQDIIANSMADYNEDGYLDGVLRSEYSGGWYYNLTVYDGVENGPFMATPGLWNTNILSDGERVNRNGYWYDWNRDGHVDYLFMIGNGNKYAQLLHDSDYPELTSREDNDTLALLINEGYYDSQSNIYYSLKSDLSHTGQPEYFVMKATGEADHHIIVREDDGTISQKNFIVPNNEAKFFRVLNAWQTVFTYDFNHDGFEDIAGLDGGVNSANDTYSSLDVFLNRGEGRYEYNAINFASVLGYYDLRSVSPKLEDFNGDGYPDLLISYHKYETETHYLAILWNNANQSFSAPQVLTGSENIYDVENLSLVDVDNNGYLDVIAIMNNNYAGQSENRGVYVWYMSSEGLLTHGFITPNDANYSSASSVYLKPGELSLLINGNNLYPIAAQADIRPAMPTNVRATMTNEGLLITWDAATDDHTPAALMRYNLSVKQQGATTYLISPQNGGENNAAYLPGYHYINATRYLIPTSALTNGNYEIALQALDVQNQLSLFTEPIVANVARNPIEVPSFACADEEVLVSYRGAETSGTPAWTFDGGIAEGYGFGPYNVTWSTGGVKTITLTVNGQTYSQTITIDDPKALEVSLPTVLYEETPASASVPDGIEYAWYVSIDGGELCRIDQYGVVLPSTSIFVSYDYRLSASGLNVTAHYKSNYSEKTLVGHQVVLYLLVTNANGCETYFTSNVTVMAATNIPTLTLVTTDANGHNVLSWTGAEAFAYVQVYKEGSYLDDFRLIGSANAAAGTYTDNASDASQKAERYRLTGITADGNESPTSAIHKTVHLTINRGVQNGTYNLIWNEYAGASVSAYRILRGASPTNLSQIAVVASSNTSYTDQTPDDNLPYYAIEYQLSGAAAAPAANHAAQANLSGRSNVVDRRTMQGLEEIISGQSSDGKLLINGVIYILRGEKVYTLTGQEVR